MLLLRLLLIAAWAFESLVAGAAASGGCSTALCSSAVQTFSASSSPSVCVELIGCINSSANIHLAVSSSGTATVLVEDAIVASLSISLIANSGVALLLNVSIRRTAIAWTSSSTDQVVPLLQMVNLVKDAATPAVITLSDVNVTLTNLTQQNGASMALVSAGSGTKRVTIYRCRFELTPSVVGKTMPPITMLNFSADGGSANLALSMSDSTFLVAGKSQSAPLYSVFLGGPVLNSAFNFSRIAVNWTVWLTLNWMDPRSSMILFDGSVNNSAVTVEDSVFTLYGRFPESGLVSGISISKGRSSNVSLSVLRHMMIASVWGMAAPPEWLETFNRLFVIQTGGVITGAIILLADANIHFAIVPNELGIDAMIVVGSEGKWTGVTLWILRSKMVLDGRSAQWMCNFVDSITSVDLMILNSSLTLISTYSGNISLTSHAVYFGAYTVSTSTLTFRNFVFNSTVSVDVVSAVQGISPIHTTLVITTGQDSSYINTVIAFENVSASFRVMGKSSNSAVVLATLTASNDSSVINSSFLVDRTVVTIVIDDAVTGELGIFLTNSVDPISNVSFSVRESTVTIKATSTLGYVAQLYRLPSMLVNVIGFQGGNFVAMCSVSLVNSNISLMLYGYVGTGCIIGVQSSTLMATIEMINVRGRTSVVGSGAATKLQASPWPSHVGIVSSNLTFTSITLRDSAFSMSCTVCLRQNEIAISASTLNGFNLSVTNTIFSVNRPQNSIPIGHVAFVGACEARSGTSLDRDGRDVADHLLRGLTHHRWGDADSLVCRQ